MGSSKGGPDRRRRNMFAGAAFAVVSVVTVAVVLAFTVFRPKQSIATVNSIRLDGLKVGFDLARLGIDINATIILDMSVTNPNRAGFDYSQGSAEINYRGGVIGEATIPPGNIGAGETIETSVKLIVMADRIVANRWVYSDLMGGRLVVATTTRIPGKVTVMGIFKRHMVMYTTCDVTINVGNGSVTSSNCKSRTKF